MTPRHTRNPLLHAAALLLLTPLYLWAQPSLGSAEPKPGTIEIGGGGVWSQGYDAGNSSALETRNTTVGTGPLTLFDTDAQMLRTAGVAAQVGVYLNRRISAEGVFQFSRPLLRLRPTSDFENAELVNIDAQVATYVIAGSVLYHFGQGRLVPFVSGGAGYLRQLHEDNAAVVTGTEFHGGGGVKLWFGSARRVGVRLDAQVSSRDKAVAFEQKRRMIPTVGAGLAVRF